MPSGEPTTLAKSPGRGCAAPGTDARPDKVVPRSGADLVAAWNSELRDLGFTTPTSRAPEPGLPIGRINRDVAADLVHTRLGAKRSAWNAADIRGEDPGPQAESLRITPPSSVARRAGNPHLLVRVEPGPLLHGDERTTLQRHEPGGPPGHPIGRFRIRMLSSVNTTMAPEARSLPT